MSPAPRTTISYYITGWTWPVRGQLSRCRFEEGQQRPSHLLFIPVEALVASMGLIPAFGMDDQHVLTDA
jgi:hypothetical protein